MQMQYPQEGKRKRKAKFKKEMSIQEKQTQGIIFEKPQQVNS